MDSSTSKQNSAYFLLSKSKTIQQYEKLKQLGAVVSYSVKTNPTIAQVLQENTDATFNVHSKEDVLRIKDPSRIWYLLQGASQEDITFAMHRGIDKFIVDNEVDLQLLREQITNTSKKIDLLLRIKAKEHTMDTGRFFVFGMSMQRAKEHIKQLHKHDNIRNIGLHMYRKTQNISEWNLISEMQQRLDEEILDKISILNIGGGLPAAYKNSSDKNIPLILEKISEFTTWMQEKNITVHMEPGRFIAAPPVTLHTFVKARYDNNIIIDASVYNAFMDSVLVLPLRLLIEGEGTGTTYTIKGATPDSLDIFRYDVQLDRDLQAGDEIIFLNAGAYNFSTTFFSLPNIPTKIVD